MRKFENVDIIEFLSAVVAENTQHYQSDFEYDKSSFTHAAASLEADNKDFLWMSRTSGTHCLNEREVFIHETASHNTWTYYAKAQDSIHAFAVEVSGIVDGEPMGTLYELDYNRHAEHVSKMAFRAQAVTLTFENGNSKQFPYEEYKGNGPSIYNTNGAITDCRFEVKDENALQSVLRQEHKAHRRFPSRNADVFAKSLEPRKTSVTQRLKQAKQAVKPPSSAKSQKDKSEPEL